MCTGYTRPQNGFEIHMKNVLLMVCIPCAEMLDGVARRAGSTAGARTSTTRDGEKGRAGKRKYVDLLWPCTCHNSPSGHLRYPIRARWSARAAVLPLGQCQCRSGSATRPAPATEAAPKSACPELHPWKRDERDEIKPGWESSPGATTRSYPRWGGRWVSVVAPVVPGR